VTANQDRGRTLRIERRERVAVVWIDVPDEEVNLLKPGFEKEFEEVLAELEGTTDLEAVILASAKSTSFIAGADVNAIKDLTDAEQASRLARTAQAVMNRLESFPRPIVAAINGACLGGGLEVALACRGRVASDHEKTRLGQPEVKLGLIPAAGGTVRLPRLIGVERALELILTGKEVRPREAETLGLVDDVVHPAILLDVAIDRARRLARGNKPGLLVRAKDALASATEIGRLKALLLEDNPAGRKVLFSQSRKKVLERTHGRMPAPLSALEVVERGIEHGPEEGFDGEAQAFGALAVSVEARNLIALFLARSELKKEPGADAQPREVRKVAVLGSGLMGGGIALITAAEADVPVRMKDVDHEKLRHGLRSIGEALTKRIGEKELRDQDADRIRHMIRPTTDYTGFGRANVVIEAVLEDLDLKRKVLKEVEAHTGPDTIFASNTSTIPVGRLAEASDRPEQVIGMHYFSPADKIPLLEVVVGRRTAAWVIATCVALGKRQGKTVILVNDSVGFYTTRIVGPYIAEAARLLMEGVPIERIDRALVEFGFPLGPLRLLDEVGIDVAQKIAETLRQEYGDRMGPAGVLARMVEGKRHGKKNGRGFYRYEPRGDGTFERHDEEVDDSVYELLGIKPDADSDPEQVALRCLLVMVNEAVRCYEAGILRSARDGDVGAVFGLGFPPFLGGPFRFIDGRGAARVTALLDDYRDRFGERFEPAPLLRTLAERGLGFHTEPHPPPGARLWPAA
jgi:3-hydroxyacyl-CoA dehydrogenase/enoyl-CoA hydratase/3-hydroxybutyryl-CoA epimerase